MKKLFAVCIIGLVLGVTGVFAERPDGLGIGIQGGGGIVGFGGALSLKLPSLPVFWAISAAATNDHTVFGVTGDIYMWEGGLLPDVGLDWYAGPGGYFNLSVDDDLDFSLGVRGVAGLSWVPPLPIALEVYVQADAGLGISISPFYFPNFGLGGNLGVRLWL
jgi:hypothetical protein